MRPMQRLADHVEPITTWRPVSGHSDHFTYIDLSAVDQDLKTIVGARTVANGEAPSRARQLVRGRDVLVSTVRPNLNGVAIVPSVLDGAIASTGFCVLRPNKTTLDPNYLFQWVKSRRFVDAMVREATGASYPAVSDGVVLGSKLPLPELSEQRRIATILEQAEALRAMRRSVLEELDTLAQAVFFDMFGDVVENTKGWPDTATLGEVAFIVSGVTKGRKLTGVARSVPYLAVSNVQDKALSLAKVKSIDASEEEISRYRLERNDLVLTEGGDPDKLGRGTLWQDELPECIHQNHVFRVRVHDERFTPLFVNWLLGSPRGKRYFLRSAKQTTGIASINMTQLRAFPLLEPPVRLQRKFVQGIESIDALRSAHRAALAQSDALLASLQHRAFRGEL